MGYPFHLLIGMSMGFAAFLTAKLHVHLDVDFIFLNSSIYLSLYNFSFCLNSNFPKQLSFNFY